MKNYIIILFVFVSILSCNNYKNDENIVISLGGEVATIDPHLNTANIGTVYIRHFFEGLMKKDKDGKIISGLRHLMVWLLTRQDCSVWIIVCGLTVMGIYSREVSKELR